MLLSNFPKKKKKKKALAEGRQAGGELVCARVYDHHRARVSVSHFSRVLVLKK